MRLTVTAYAQIVANYRAAVENDRPFIADAMRDSLVQALHDGVERELALTIVSECILAD